MKYVELFKKNVIICLGQLLTWKKSNISLQRSVRETRPTAKENER